MEASEDDQYVDAVIRTSFLANAALFLSSTVLVFDHFLTFSSEVEHIWKRKPTPLSVLFLLNRYFALLAICKLISANISDTNRFACSDFNSKIPLILLSTVTALIAEAMLTLRAYAVYHNNKLVLGLLSTAWIAHLAAMIVAVVRGINGGEIEIPHKTVAIFAPLSLRKNSGILYILPAIVFDIIAGTFLTLGLYRRSGSYKAKTPLVKLIIQDGLLYFMVVFVSNLAWILLHIFKANDWTFPARVVEFVPLEVWSACITTIMIGRLTLNLRMCDPAGDELTFQTLTLRFRQRASTATLTDGPNIAHV